MIVSRDMLERRIEQFEIEFERMVKEMAEVRDFLRLLNDTEEDLPDVAKEMFDELCDKHIPNG